MGLRVCCLLLEELRLHGGTIVLRGKHPDFTLHTDETGTTHSVSFHPLRDLQIALHWRGIDDSHIAALTHNLTSSMTQSCITALSLSGQVGNTSTTHLADLLSKATRLRTLDLGYQVRVRAGRRCKWWLDCASSRGEGDQARASISASGMR